MGAGNSTLPIKHGLPQAFRLPLGRVNRATGSEPQQSEKLEITVTQTITQETSPIVRPDNDTCRNPRMRSPSLLTINSAAALSPSGSPAGVALGIPAEHILDINPSEIDTPPMPRLTFSNLAGMTGAETFTIPSTRSSLIIAESGRSSNMQNPFEGSPMSDQNTIPQWPLVEPIQPSANQLRDIPSLELPSEHIAEVSRYESNPSACHFCKFEYSENIEAKVYLPCGHSFGINCLYEWIVLEQHTDQIRCPHHCISLRHHCGHLVAPSNSAPYPLHTDVSATTIPAAYGFCRKGKGRMLSRDIKRLQAIQYALARDAIDAIGRGRVRKVLDVLCFRRPPFCKKLLSGVIQLKAKAESEVHRRQAFWWIDEWVKGGQVPIGTWTAHPFRDSMDVLIYNAWLHYFAVEDFKRS